MIDWLNDNAGAVQAVATVILVVVTAVYALLVWAQARSGAKLADETSGLVRQTQKLVAETRRQTRPYVFVEVVRRGNILDTSVRNTGERGAENIVIEVEHDVHLSSEDRGFLGWPLFQKPIPFLPPGRSVSQLVNFHSQVAPHLPSMPPDQRVLHYTIRYKDAEEEYQASYVYDLSWLAPVGGDPWPLAGDALSLIKEEVKQLHQSFVREMEGLRQTLGFKKGLGL
jgi:hypothetical protein